MFQVFLGHARFLGRSLRGEGRQWWSGQKFLPKFGKFQLPEVKRTKNLPLIPVLLTPVHDPEADVSGTRARWSLTRGEAHLSICSHSLVHWVLL